MEHAVPWLPTKPDLGLTSATHPHPYSVCFHPLPAFSTPGNHSPLPFLKGQETGDASAKHKDVLPAFCQEQGSPASFACCRATCAAPKALRGHRKSGTQAFCGCGTAGIQEVVLNLLHIGCSVASSKVPRKNTPRHRSFSPPPLVCTPSQHNRKEQFPPGQGSELHFN